MACQLSLQGHSTAKPIGARLKWAPDSQLGSADYRVEHVNVFMKEWFPRFAHFRVHRKRFFVSAISGRFRHGLSLLEHMFAYVLRKHWFPRFVFVYLLNRRFRKYLCENRLNLYTNVGLFSFLETASKYLNMNNEVRRIYVYTMHY